MPKSPTQIGPPYGHERAVFNSSNYLGWITDLETIGLDDESVDEVFYVATGYRSNRAGGFDD